MGYINGPVQRIDGQDYPIALFPHFHAFAESKYGQIVWAALTRENGVWLWRSEYPWMNLMDRVREANPIPAQQITFDPVLHWDQNDNRLLVSSVDRKERGIMLLPVPGYWYDRMFPVYL